VTYHQVGSLMGGERSTVVKHVYKTPKVKGSISAIAAGTAREKMA